MWFGNSIASNLKTLQRIANAAGKITFASFRFHLPHPPSLQSNQHWGRLHPTLTQLLQSSVPSPLGRRHWRLSVSCIRLHNSFIQQAVRRLNSLRSLTPLLFCPLERLDYTQTHPYFQCQQIYKKSTAAVYKRLHCCFFIYLISQYFFLCIIMHIDITTIFRL